MRPISCKIHIVTTLSWRRRIAVGIQPPKSIEIFSWAENQGHSQAYAKEVLRRLEQGDQGGKEGVIKALGKNRDILSNGGTL